MLCNFTPMSRPLHESSRGLYCKEREYSYCGISTNLRIVVCQPKTHRRIQPPILFHWDEIVQATNLSVGHRMTWPKFWSLTRMGGRGRHWDQEAPYSLASGEITERMIRNEGSSIYTETRHRFPPWRQDVFATLATVSMTLLREYPWRHIRRPLIYMS